MPHKDLDVRREYQRQYQLKWRAANPEKLEEYRIRWRKAGPKRPAWSQTRTYVSWSRMKQRVLWVKDKSYPRYGGRGITIHEPWLVFANFLADMGERPEGMTLDRIDNDGNYEPGNCRWATPREQRLNQ